jgi:hypothetical protein
MNEAYSGGCACAAIRYEIAGEPLAMVDCHAAIANARAALATGPTPYSREGT